jgi:hypothetical protein
VLVIYVPVLQTAFHTVALSAFDWMVATAVASTLLIGMDAAKVAWRLAPTTIGETVHGESARA